MSYSTPLMEQFEARRLLSVNVLTYHNDNQRTGDNLAETTLTPSNVTDSTFGKVGTLNVDGQVYAQPLYVSHLTFPNGKVHNVVYVATEADRVYAFDAGGGGMLWERSFTSASQGITTVPAAVTGDTVDLFPQFGITSTPVIDLAKNSIYVVDNTRETNHGSVRYAQRLYALNLITGAEENVVLIKATAPGDGAGSVNGVVSFNALRNLQRSALTLLNGTIYIAWSSHGDLGTYHGWIIGYNENTFAQNFVWTDEPNGGDGGIWDSGDGLAVDSSNDLYALIGNGNFDEDPADGEMQDYGDSFVKFAPGATEPTDFFTPSNQATLNSGDLDLNSGGVMILPSQAGPVANEAVFAGKQGTIYVVNLDDLGGYDTTSDQVVQELSGNNGVAGSFGTPAYFDSRVYYLGSSNDNVKYYPIVDGQLQPDATVFARGSFPFPGGSPEISANGSANGIVWVVGDGGKGEAVLHAYDANTLTQLYTSEDEGKRDQAGTYNKFTPPTIANGRVFVAAQGQVDVYGLLG